MSETSSLNAASLLSASSASARLDRYVSRSDQNKDGQISFSEFGDFGQNLPGTTAGSATSSGSSLKRMALFSQIDKDSDGSLSVTELKDFQKAQVAAANTALLSLQELFGNADSSAQPDATQADAVSEDDVKAATPEAGGIDVAAIPSMPEDERSEVAAEFTRYRAYVAEAEAALRELSSLDGRSSGAVDAPTQGGTVPASI